jgi:hypothetical protein
MAGAVIGRVWGFSCTGKIDKSEPDQIEHITYLRVNLITCQAMNSIDGLRLPACLAEQGNFIKSMPIISN